MADKPWMAGWFVKVMKFFAHRTAPTEEQQQPDSSQSYDEDKTTKYEASVKDCSDEEDMENSHEASSKDGSDDDDSESPEELSTEATDADTAVPAASAGINSTNGSIRNLRANVRRARAAAFTGINSMNGNIGDLWANVRRAAGTKVTTLATKARDAMANAINIVRELGLVGTARAIGNWMKNHPWETAAIIALIALASTAIGLSVVGFGAGGVAAGSIAAGIQAGIGNVVAGSLFATCTSAMMGGAGGLIIFGGVGVGTFAIVGMALAAWRRRTSQGGRAIIQTSNPTTPSDLPGKLVDDAIFWVVCASAVAVYYMKSWWRGNSSRPGGPRDD